MKYFLFIFLSLNAYAVENFIIEYSDIGYKYSAASKKSEKVSISIRNQSSQKMIGAFYSGEKQLSTVTIFSETQHVSDFNLKLIKNLSFIPLSPPGKRINFKFNGEKYEIPKKK